MAFLTFITNQLQNSNQKAWWNPLLLEAKFKILFARHNGDPMDFTAAGEVRGKMPPSYVWHFLE